MLDDHGLPTWTFEELLELHQLHLKWTEHNADRARERRMNITSAAVEVGQEKTASSDYCYSPLPKVDIACDPSHKHSPTQISHSISQPLSVYDTFDLSHETPPATSDPVDVTSVALQVY